MNRLREIWFHIDPSMDPVEIMRRSFDIALDKVDPMRRKPATEKSAAEQKFSSGKSTQPRDLKKNSQSVNQQNVTQQPADSVRQRVRVTYYSKELDRQLWQRAESRCEFVDPLTNRRCDCTTLLQHEHVVPLALGGTNELSNLQLLCRTHNLLRARQVFGDRKIDHHHRRN